MHYESVLFNAIQQFLLVYMLNTQNDFQCWSDSETLEIDAKLYSRPFST